MNKTIIGKLAFGQRRIKKIVTIGGGSGQFVLLSGLRDLKNIKITAIVSMVDSGGSTGRLRDEYGVLPPGDILKCVLALSKNRDAAREILQKRFTCNNRLNGHIAGNMLLTILSQYAGSFPEGVKALGEVLDCEGQVLPVTTDKATLTAQLSDGSWLYGETVIDVPKNKRRAKIEKTFLVPHHSESIKVYPPVIKEIISADYIIIGPGDLYTSITPNFLVEGVKAAIINTKAKIVYITNIMTKCGETDNFTAKNFINTLENFIGRKIDFAVINATRPEKKIVSQYYKHGSKLVEANLPERWEKRIIIKKDLLNTSGDIARHDSEKLAGIVNEIVTSRRN